MKTFLLLITLISLHIHAQEDFYQDQYEEAQEESFERNLPSDVFERRDYEEYGNYYDQYDEADHFSDQVDRKPATAPESPYPIEEEGYPRDDYEQEERFEYQESLTNEEY